eukprot:196167-Chlamydomonas_euryale.AAC.2
MHRVQVCLAATRAASRGRVKQQVGGGRSGAWQSEQQVGGWREATREGGDSGARRQAGRQGVGCMKRQGPRVGGVGAGAAARGCKQGLGWPEAAGATEQQNIV